MKKTVSIFVVILAMAFVVAQRSPAEMENAGWQYVSSNCNSINLGFVTITTGSITYSRTNAATGTMETTSVPCSDGDRWHWFWE